MTNFAKHVFFAKFGKVAKVGESDPLSSDPLSSDPLSSDLIVAILLVAILLVAILKQSFSGLVQKRYKNGTYVQQRSP